MIKHLLDGNRQDFLCNNDPFHIIAIIQMHIMGLDDQLRQLFYVTGNVKFGDVLMLIPAVNCGYHAIH